MKNTAASIALLFATSAASAQSCPNMENTGRPQFLPPADGAIVSGFGERTHPISHKTRMHPGVDYGLAFDQPVRAAASGQVLFSGSAPGYGNYITLRHAGGYETSYAHLHAIAVQRNACVQAGDVIGRSGTTVLLGPHLHFEMRINGRFVDPGRYLADNRPKQ